METINLLLTVIYIHGYLYNTEILFITYTSNIEDAK